MRGIHTPTDQTPTPHVLTTLAHLGCATLSQLHALCFPQAFASTVRLALIDLVEAGLITHSQWRLTHGERCQVWTITTRGLDRLRQDTPQFATTHAPDLNRPSTPREKDEWRVRIEVRTLLVRLIMEARQQPVCAHAVLSTSLLYPLPVTPDVPPQPDAQIAITWEPAIVHPPDWLPWMAALPSDSAMRRYAVYVERSGYPRTLARWVEHCTRAAQASTPLLILATPERCTEVIAILQHHQPSPILLCSRSDLGEGLLSASWRDAAGQPGALRPEQPMPVSTR